MKPSEKRKSTQLGLGKVTAEGRHTSKRERVDADADANPGSVPPVSAPPPSGGPISAAPAPRHTLPMESRRAHPPNAVESERPKGEHESKERIARNERIDVDAERAPTSVRHGGPMSRTPIEVTQVDTQRIPRALAGTPAPPRSSPPRWSPPRSNPPGRDGRFAAEEVTGRRPIPARVPGSRPDDRAETGSRTVDGRPIGNRPASGRPAERAPSGAPPQPGSGEATKVARSARMSIREDNVGGAATAAAVGAAGRAVPKIVKTKAEIAAAPIDHRAGFLLAHIDGVTSVAGLVDICGMPEDQVNEILDRLRRLGIVAVR